MPQVIERNSEVPYYQQLFEILRERITDGQIAVDERLASETELGKEFGLSRATIRQTLAKLESEGYARRVARRGVFAASPDPGPGSGWVVQDSQSFLESQLRHSGRGVHTSVLDARFVAPPEHVAEALQAGPGHRVFALERLRSLNGRTAMFSTNWFPTHVGDVVEGAGDVLDGTGSLNNTLRKAGFMTSGAHRVIHALPAPRTIAAHLGVQPGQAVLRVRSLSWDHRDVRFDYYETWVLTDVVPLEVNVVAG